MFDEQLIIMKLNNFLLPILMVVNSIQPVASVDSG